MPKQQQKKTDKKPPVAAPQPLMALKPLSPVEQAIKFLSDKRNQLLLIGIITFAFYGNSIADDYALDDIMFITHNQFVQKGVDGINDLFTKESMYGFIGSASPISGGRWRPLSLITFALEKQFFGSQPGISHFINVFLLALTGIIMILFLRKYVFIASPIAAFMVVLLFIINPVHTEAIANIKSRDELLSWLFLLLTMYCSLNFLTQRNYWQLLYALVCYFTALLSKENGLVFIAILPVTFYIFTKAKPLTVFLTSIPFAGIVFLYIVMRIHYVPFVVGSKIKEVMNAPYLYATPVQHYATAIMMLGKYLLLLVWPNPLSIDYSYNQVPYVTFSDWRVWLSILFQAAVIIYAVVAILKTFNAEIFKKQQVNRMAEKNIIAYGILFYFFSMVLYSNLSKIDIGTFIGERFLYQPSFGFCIALVVCFNEITKRIKFKDIASKFYIVATLVAAVVLLSGFQTIRRNAEWKGDTTLWPIDVKAVPNSARAQNGCGMAQILLTNDLSKSAEDSVKKLQLLHEAIAHLKRAHEIQPTYIDPWLNMGVAYSRLENYDSTEYCWLKAKQLDSTHPMLVVQYEPVLCIDFMNQGLKAGTYKDYSSSIRYFYRALKYNKKNADVWYNLGGAYYTIGRYDSAAISWQQCLKLKPGYTKAKQGLQALTTQKIKNNK